MSSNCAICPPSTNMHQTFCEDCPRHSLCRACSLVCTHQAVRWVSCLGLIVESREFWLVWNAWGSKNIYCMVAAGLLRFAGTSGSIGKTSWVPKQAGCNCARSARIQEVDQSRNHWAQFQVQCCTVMILQWDFTKACIGQKEHWGNNFTMAWPLKSLASISYFWAESERILKLFFHVPHSDWYVWCAWERLRMFLVLHSTEKLKSV